MTRVRIQTWRRLAPLLAGGAFILMLLTMYLPAGPESAWACKKKRGLPTKIGTISAKRATICLINNRRKRRGIPRLDPSRKLNKAAHRHSGFMERHHCFSHQCPGEASLIGRVSATGYLSGARSYGCGEALGWDKGRDASPKRMVQHFMNSSEHRSVLLSRTYRQIGVGVVWGSPHKANARAGIYTVDLCFRNR